MAERDNINLMVDHVKWVQVRFLNVVLMSNTKDADLLKIERRTAAWNARPKRSLEMYAKTSDERAACKRAVEKNKQILKTMKGKSILEGVQKHIQKNMNSNRIQAKFVFTKVK